MRASGRFGRSGVGAVISGHYSGWNLGLVAGLRLHVLRDHHHRHHVSGPDLLARRDVAGAAAYRRRLFVRAHVDGAMGGLHHGHRGEHRVRAHAGRDRVLHRLVSLGIFGTEPSFQPVYWVLSYALFVGLNVFGVELSFKVTVTVTLMALAVSGGLLRLGAVLRQVRLLALGAEHRRRTARSCRMAAVRSCRFGIGGHPRHRCRSRSGCSLPSSNLPLAAEESHDPQRDMPKGIIAGILTLIVSAFLVLFLNSGIAPGAAGSGEVRRAAARRLPHALWHRHREDPGGGRRDRADRVVPHHHLRVRAADLFALARGLFPELPVGDARHAQNPASWR